jgi:hypothetical protein
MIPPKKSGVSHTKEYASNTPTRQIFPLSSLVRLRPNIFHPPHTRGHALLVVDVKQLTRSGVSDDVSRRAGDIVYTVLTPSGTMAHYHEEELEEFRGVNKIDNGMSSRATCVTYQRLFMSSSADSG